MEKKETTTIVDRRWVTTKLSTALVGLHDILVKEIRNFCEKEKGKSLEGGIVVYEYFAIPPLSIESENIYPEKYMTCPFVLRYLEGEVVMPLPSESLDKSKSSVKFKEIYFPALFEDGLLINWENVTFANMLYEVIKENRLKEQITRRPKVKAEVSQLLDFRIGETIVPYYLVIFDHNHWEKYIIDAKDNVTKKTKSIEFGIHKLKMPLDFNAKVPTLVVPIVSDSFFYGEVWVWLISHSEEISDLDVSKWVDKLVKDEQFFLNNIALKVFKLSRELFVDQLALFWEFISQTYEYVYSESGSNKKYSRSSNKTIEVVNPFNIRRSKSDEKSQISFVDDCLVKWYNQKNLKDSINKPLSNFLTISPSMVKVVREAMKIGFTLRKSGKSLPSVLIIGGAGSGKERVANILLSFSKEYSNTEKFVVNMATMKPSLVSGSALSGAELKIGNINKKGDTVFNTYQIKGILDKIKDNIKIVKKEGIKEGKAVIIFDELNTLDVEAQGFLLRYLEEGQVDPLGKASKHNGNKRKNELDVFIIGIMNEDPSILTLEKTVSTLEDREVLGDILTSLLLEYAKRQRRLRPDIFDRIARNGILRIPSLSERRHEIPLLLTFWAEKHFSNLLKSDLEHFPIVFLTFEAMDLLMNPLIDWKGNVRTLQALAYHCIQLAYSKRDEEHYIFIDKFLLEQSMEDLGISWSS